MNLFKRSRTKLVGSRQSGRELGHAELVAVGGGTPGQMNPIHRPAPHPIVYVPILIPFPIRRLPG